MSLKPTARRRVPWYIGPGKDLAPDELTEFEGTGEYLIEPKIDGMWAYLEVGSPEEGRPNLLKSRDATTGGIESASAGDLRELQIPLPEGTVLVGELEAASQWATERAERQGFRCLHLFDLPRLGRDDSLVAVPLRKRKRKLFSLYEKIKEIDVRTRLRLVPSILPADLERYDPDEKGHFRSLYDGWIDAGYEGCVIKHVDSLYETRRLDGKRPDWLRCKKWITEDYVFYGIGETPGGVYSDPKPTGQWGLYKKGKLVKVMQAACPEHFLREENVGKLVCEFKGWFKMKSGALRHAQFVRSREDKDPSFCVLS